MSMRKIVLLCIVVNFFMGCESKEDHPVEKNKSSVSHLKIIEKPTSDFVTKTFGNGNRIVYIVGIVHDGGLGSLKSKKQVEMLVDSFDSSMVEVYLEGVPYKQTFSYNGKKSKIHRILSFLTSRNVSMYGGEDMRLHRDHGYLLKYLMVKGSEMPDEEVCTFLFANLGAKQIRTDFFMKSLSKADSNKIPIGIMGEDHFTAFNYPDIQSFAEKNNLKIVLYTSKKASKQDLPDWNLDKCGKWEDASKSTAKTLYKMRREEGMVK